MANPHIPPQLSRRALIRTALNDGLLALPAGGGLPVPPLLDIITEYAMPIPLVTTAAGIGGTFGCTSGIGTAARLNQPIHCCVWNRNPKPNKPATATATATAANGTASAAAASPVVRTGFTPTPIVVASVDEHYHTSGDCLVFTEYGTHLVRAMDLVTRRVWTLVAPPIERTHIFKHPSGICVDPSTNSLLVVQWSGHVVNRIKHVAASDGSGGVSTVVSVVAGTGSEGSTDGVLLDATFKNPAGIVCSSDGRYAMLCTHYTDGLRRLDFENDRASTVRAKLFELVRPQALCWDPFTSPDTELYVVGNGIVKYDCKTQTCRALPGLHPESDEEYGGMQSSGVCPLSANTIVITSWNLRAVFLINTDSGERIQLAGGGKPLDGATTARAGGGADVNARPPGTALSNPMGLSVWSNGATGEQEVYVMDNQNSRIQCLTGAL